MRWLTPILLTLALVGCTQPAQTPAKPAPVPPPVAQAAPPAAKAETPLTTQPAPAPVEVKLPTYVPDPSCPAQGSITSIGSDSMDPLMQLWFDDFKTIHPGLAVTLISKGSATCPPALIAGKSIMGQMSREMNADEIAAFVARFGYQPTRVVVAMDALAVYVNANNPISKLTLDQVDAIFSKTQKGGYGRSLDTWGDLGLGQEWSTRTIQPYGRDENSGTRAFFKERVMKNGDYKDNVKTVFDQFALVEAAAMDASGICYGPIQHQVRMVKAVPIIDFKASTAILPTVENILDGRYPLARFLYVYLNLRPGQPMDPMTREFFRFILSRQGQSDVANFGAIPLPGDLAAMNLAKLK
jgi:phosphate transport system substrate-binding protein